MTKDNHGYNQYTKEEIIQLAQDWFDKNGRLVQRDLKHANNLPSSAQVTKHFGSLQNLLKEAKVDISLLEILIKLAIIFVVRMQGLLH